MGGGRARGEIGPRVRAPERLDEAHPAGGEIQLANVLKVLVPDLVGQELGSEFAAVLLAGGLLLALVHADAVQHLELAEVVDTVESVLPLLAHGVARQVQDDQLGQLLQHLRLLQRSNVVVANVQLHERGEVLQAVQGRYFVVLQRQLGEPGQGVQALNVGQLVLPQVQFAQARQPVQALHLEDPVLLQGQLLQ